MCEIYTLGGTCFGQVLMYSQPLHFLCQIVVIFYATPSQSCQLRGLTICMLNWPTMSCTFDHIHGRSYDLQFKIHWLVLHACYLQTHTHQLMGTLMVVSDLLPCLCVQGGQFMHVAICYTRIENKSISTFELICPWCVAWPMLSDLEM